MALVSSPAAPQPDEYGLKWWAVWDDTTGTNIDPAGEVYTEIHWDNSAGVAARTARIMMKDGSVITATAAVGATGVHTLNKPQQQSWLGIQFLLA